MRGLTEDELKAQAERCPCRGADDMCVCQNAPDATTRKAWGLHDNHALSGRIAISLNGLLPVSDEQAHYYANSNDVPSAISAMARELLAVRKYEQDCTRRP